MFPAVRALKPYPMAQLQGRKAALAKAGVTIYDFGTGDPLEPTPSFIPEALRQSLPVISQYPSVAGTPKLRQAAADYLLRRYGVIIDPGSQILPSAGSKEAIFRLDASTGRDTVIHGTPGYPVYQSGALFAGGREHQVVLERAQGYRLDLTKLSSEVLDRTAVAWLNYPHNPTGACVDVPYYRAQLEACRAHGIILASDECYQDLWFDGAEPPPSALQATEGNLSGLLVFHSCSKRSGMTGYRSGFIAGDPVLIAAYRGWRAHFGVGSPAFIESAAAFAWQDDRHVAERRTAFAAKYQCLSEGLTAKGIEILPSRAGLYLWAQVPHNGDADSYAQACLERGIVISPGGFFGAGGEGWFRLALVPSLADCRQALATWP